MCETKNMGGDVGSANHDQLGMSHLLAVSFPHGNPQGVSAINEWCFPKIGTRMWCIDFLGNYDKT